MKQVGKRELGDHEKYFTLDICVNDEEDEDQEVPYVRYRFRDWTQKQQNQETLRDEWWKKIAIDFEKKNEKVPCFLCHTLYVTISCH